jgi:hypothetical protein
MHYREAAVNLLTNPELDPYAHIPEFKVCAVSVARIGPAKRATTEGSQELAHSGD